MGEDVAVSTSMVFFVDPVLLNLSIFRMEDFDREPGLSSTGVPNGSGVDEDAGVDKGVVDVNSNCMGPVN